MLPQPSRRGPESNRCAGLCRPLPKPLGHPAGMKQPGFPGLPPSLTCDRKAARFSLRSRLRRTLVLMDAPDRCPECGSDELRTTTRKGDMPSRRVRGEGLVLGSEGRTPAGRPIEELHPSPLARCVEAVERTREPILGIEILAGEPSRQPSLVRLRAG